MLRQWNVDTDAAAAAPDVAGAAGSAAETTGPTATEAETNTATARSSTRMIDCLPIVHRRPARVDSHESPARDRPDDPRARTRTRLAEAGTSGRGGLAAV